MGLAITSFVLALIGCCCGIVPMIMSWVAMSRARRGIGGGHGIALAAFIISIAWLLFSVIGTAVAYRALAVRDASGVITEKGYLLADELRAGDCLDRPGRTPLLVKAVPCGVPHEVEAFDRLPAVASVPESELAVLCAQSFKRYVGLRPERSELVLMAVRVEATMFGDSEGIACLVGQTGDVKIAGSLRNARR